VRFLFIDKSHRRVPVMKPLLREARQRCQDSLLQTHIAMTESAFVMHANEKLTAFIEAESAIRG